MNAPTSCMHQYAALTLKRRTGEWIVFALRPDRIDAARIAARLRAFHLDARIAVVRANECSPGMSWPPRRADDAL